MTFGQFIARAREGANLDQLELAARIRREDGFPILAAYVDDLEHDRRPPPGHHVLRQFAEALQLPLDYLCFLAGHYPQDLREGEYSPERVQAAFRAFRLVVQGHDATPALAS